MENIKKRQGKQHRNTKSTFEVGSKAGKEVPPEKLQIILERWIWIINIFIWKIFLSTLSENCQNDLEQKQINDMTAFQPKLSTDANGKTELCFLTDQVNSIDIGDIILATLGLSAEAVTNSNIRRERVGQRSQVCGKVAIQTFSNLPNGFYLHPQ